MLFSQSEWDSTELEANTNLWLGYNSLEPLAKIPLEARVNRQKVHTKNPGISGEKRTFLISFQSE